MSTLAVRIVPRAPGGVVEGLLDVEHDEAERPTAQEHTRQPAAEKGFG